MEVMTDPLTTDLFPQALRPVTLQGPVDLEGFRRAARRLLARHIPPDQVTWRAGGTALPDGLANKAALPDDTSSDTPTISVPPDFLAVCEAAILHRDPDRFDLLYRLLWRLVHEPALRRDPLDADIVRARQMAQAVRRDIHDIKAFVRFRRVQDDTFTCQPEGGPLHVAWFEPAHHILPTVAPFFARRFRQMRWALLTPEGSVEWDGTQLHAGPGAQKADVPAPQAGERLWLRYYRHTFRPRATRAGRRGLPPERRGAAAPDWRAEPARQQTSLWPAGSWPG